MRVALYVTCLCDQFRPEVGLASAALLRHAGCEVVFDATQTCCGQPLCNTGYPQLALPLAHNLIAGFERSRADALVCPSGSCTAQIRRLPQLLAADRSWHDRAAAVAARTFELSWFLRRERSLASVPGRYAGTIGWHDACHGLRDLGIRDEPRELLRLCAGVELRELAWSDACCGFGGTFAVRYPEISVAIADRKIEAIAAAGIDAIASGDFGCLMHLDGRLRHRGTPVRVLHLAEVLAAGAWS